MSMALWSIGWQAMPIPRVLLCPFTLQGPLALLALSGATGTLPPHNETTCDCPAPDTPLPAAQDPTHDIIVLMPRVFAVQDQLLGKINELTAAVEDRDYRIAGYRENRRLLRIDWERRTQHHNAVR